jgi:hypothetical protein
MRRCLCWFSLALAVLVATHAVRADDTVTFTVLPPDVSGPAGTTVGWGYSITNNSTTDYLDISGVDAGVFLDGTPDSSPFLFSFSSLAPGATDTQAYDPLNDLGLFQLTWDADAPVGFTNSGTFGLYGAFCDPSLGDNTCAEDLSVPSTDLAFADYSATVSPSGVVATPEPGTLLLLCSGLSMVALGSKRRKFEV